MRISIRGLHWNLFKLQFDPILCQMQYFVSATWPEPYMVNRRQTVRLPRKQTPPTHSEQTAKSVALAKSRSQSIRGGHIYLCSKPGWFFFQLYLMRLGTYYGDFLSTVECSRDDTEMLVLRPTASFNYSLCVECEIMISNTSKWSFLRPSFWC